MANDGNNIVVNKNGIEKKYDNVIDTAYSSNRDSFSILVNDNNSFYVVKDGIEGKKYDLIKNIQYINDVLTYKAMKNFKWTLVVNNEEGKYYDNVYLPKISNNRKLYLYIGEKNGFQILIKNKTEIGTYNQILDYKISSNNKDIVYLAKKGNKAYVYKNNYKLSYFPKVVKVNILPNGDVYFVFNANKIYKGGNIYGEYENISNIVAGYSKIAYLNNDELYENGKLIGNVYDVKKMFYIKDALFIVGKVGDKEGIYTFSCSKYLDNFKEQRYIYLIKKYLGKRIKMISNTKRKKIANKVDKIIKKVIVNPRYSLDKKIKKVTLFTAFKKVLLDFSW